MCFIPFSPRLCDHVSWWLERTHVYTRVPAHVTRICPHTRSSVVPFLVAAFNVNYHYNAHMHTHRERLADTQVSQTPNTRHIRVKSTHSSFNSSEDKATLTHPPHCLPHHVVFCHQRLLAGQKAFFENRQQQALMLSEMQQHLTSLQAEHLRVCTDLKRVQSDNHALTELLHDEKTNALRFSNASSFLSIHLSIYLLT